MKNIIWLIGVILVCNIGCKKGDSTKTTSNNTPVIVVNKDTSFAKGADVSWLTQMEASGYQFYNNSGTQQDCMQILKGKGMNAIRLRVWVNPVGGWCNTADMVTKAKRATALGMKILIDFHYSDTWADPGDQTKPAAWANMDFNTLVTTVHDYTKAVIDTLKLNGITPTWVQVGNETSDGMLWEDGRASTNMGNFAKLIAAGYQGVKDASSTTKVIVHLANGYDNTTFRWLFDGLKSNGAKWDIIGMSLYPTASNWQTYDTECLANMNDMVSRYGTPVMICESGFSASDATTAKAFLTDLISKTRSVSNNNGLGVFYWEPEAYNWMNYGLGAFDNTGKPTVALDAFAN
ncbi:glycosyl hydrolase 53 family protein [Mucilaginibacter sp. L196]|uniref:glycoside hydrolase family 53 protein n=1 Tax=Mucilaginibacter sp. L196 TaxID=1641870 RepID=UPI00131D95B1|nr:glycosyl hydrolase 53 family protein [Mucilaginibacter sp. L196]